VDRLLSEGWQVRLLDDFSSGRESNVAHLNGKVELLRGDLRDRSLIEKALVGVDVVFHQAAVPSVPRSVAEPERTHDVNVNGTLGLLEAARSAGVRRLVFASSSSAYGDTPELPKVETMAPCPLSPYALQKYTGERYCQLYHRLYGLETVALRYFNVYGPRQNPESEYAAVSPRFASACLASQAPVVFGDGEQTRDFTFVGDAVSANLLAAEAPGAPGEVINVAGGRRVSLNQLLAEIREITGAKILPRHEAARPGDVRDSLASLERARELLGYEPQVELRTGLATTVEHLESVRES
jgi:UDP-glucose 4-epimerase